MNWLLFGLVGVLTTVLDQSFMPVLRIGEHWPSLTPGVVVFAALWASRPSALWGAFLLGLLQDLSRPEVIEGERTIRVLGPDALGWLFGAVGVLAVRRLLLRRHPLAVGAATLWFLLLASVVWGGIWTVRGFLPGTVLPWTPGEAGEALASRAITAAYAAVVAVPLAWVLALVRPWWGFPGGAWTAGRRAAP